ncbi:hypothetical protein ALC60_12450 [Trachymyrmex zeteki]|uniref:Reverse transcriptase domain-containing protein n=1 Tax=Mycetomoellerius zeteki TaxID=64791 RepID=A0A151WKU5_9HYME|nr:hypothetical protein ALC60_12450 [Trachymyrmex zeteki]
MTESLSFIKDTLFSLDVVSLFTNVPINLVIEGITDRLYRQTFEVPMGIDDLCNMFNNYHPRLRFTLEEGGDRLNFLDVTLIKIKNFVKSFKVRISEYKNHINWKKKHSVITDHRLEHGHESDWNNIDSS